MPTAALTVILCGCGSATETPEAFRQRADAICARFDRLVHHIEGLPAHPPAGFVHREGRQIEELASEGRRALDELRELHPPPAYRASFGDYLDAGDRRFALAARSGRAYAADDPISAELLRGQGIRLEWLQKKAVKGIPFKRCARR